MAGARTPAPRAHTYDQTGLARRRLHGFPCNPTAGSSVRRGTSDEKELCMTTQTAERGQEKETGQELTRRGGELESERGLTTIADGVVAKVVGLATREV